MVKIHDQQMTLGGLIAALEKQDPDMDVEFDFVYFHPEGIHSFRGFYDQLALGYDRKGDHPKVVDLLTLYRGAVGKVFQGYKGGDYQMEESTPIWISNQDESSDTILVGVVELNSSVVFQTEKVPW